MNGGTRGRAMARRRRGVLMQNGLYVALSAQVALERRLDTIAANVANMNTPGYRADGVSFEAEIAKAGENNLSYVTPGSGFVSRRSGPLIPTGNAFDVAVQGDGWFALNGPAGVIYTRDGRMKLSETGALLNLNGVPILDAGGAPIQLDGAGGPPAISGDGMITQNGRQVSAIGLFTLDPDAKLTRAGSSGFTSDKAGQPILDFTQNGVVQGSIEGANVNPIEEMTKLIAVTRNFDGVNTEVTQTENSMTDAIKTLGGAA
jgi:flagellar basal-body rod protein FlgF